MSEYSFVEKPFLDQLAALDWTVIDQGAGIPTDPTKSLRTSFREVTLRDEFNKAVRVINTSQDGRQWLTDKELDDLHDELIGQTARSLVETNEAVLKLLFRSQVDANELTGEQYPNVKLIDFEHPERNSFLAINQFRIDTPGAGKGFIIPGNVLFFTDEPRKWLPGAQIDVVIFPKGSGGGERIEKTFAGPLHEQVRDALRYL